ncbi:DUF1698 domain-containing protein, partial [Pseudomonas aeruginosa]|uniref:DUF1698 domain-containing protein n=1 Tax=Pseudomonas aeruginosa TaxID=287 RepID=UPI003969651D
PLFIIYPMARYPELRTEWMRFQSLPEFLDPQDRSRTVEGLPAPMRATLVARKP